MNDFFQWSIDVRRFCRRWYSRLGGYIGRNDFLELFVTEEWNRFEQEFHMLFDAGTPRRLSEQLNPEARSAVISPTVALLDLMQSLSTSLEGASSLAPVEYFVAIVEELKRLADRLEEDRVRYYQEETFEEVISIDPEMVEEEVSLELQESEPEKPVIEDQITARTKNPLATPLDPATLAPRIPKLKRKKGKDGNANVSEEKLDPEVPVLSLAGKKKTKAVLTIPASTGALPSVALPLYEAIGRVSRGLEQPGEAELIAYLGRRFEELRPPLALGAAAALAQLDARIGALANADIKEMANASKAVDLLARSLFHSWQQLIVETPPNYVKIVLSEPTARTSPLGEWRDFSLECIPRQRIPGFSKARIDVHVHYVAPQFTIQVRAQGAVALPPPFSQGEAMLRLDLSNETEALAGAWLSQITSLFFSRLGVIAPSTGNEPV